MLIRKIKIIVLCLSMCGVCLPENSTDITDQEINDVMKYLETFTTLTQPDPHIGASSSDGTLVPSSRLSKEEFMTSPVVVENILTIQNSAGMAQTGNVDRGLVEVMNKGRCGMSDPPPPGSGLAAFTEQSRWRTKKNTRTGKHELNYSFFPETFPTDPSISRLEVEKGILAAMCMWEWNSNIVFKTNLGDGVTSADVTIKFGKGDHGDHWPFDGPGKTLAHAFYPESGKLHFDLDEPWFLSLNGVNENRKKDVFTVAAHELGHTLGLAHSTVRHALMAPYYTYVTSFENYFLPEDDVNGIQRMYGEVPRGSNPSISRNSACYQLRSIHLTETAGRTSTSTPTTTTTTRRPATTTTRAPLPTTTPTSRCEDKLTHCRRYKIRNYCTNYRYRSVMARNCAKTCNMCVRGEAPCEDKPTYADRCAGWKQQKICMDPVQARVMATYCKKTCGLCPVVVDHKPTAAAIPSDSVCSLTSFDTVVTVRDSNGHFFGYFIKGDYLFPMDISVSGHRESYSLLNETYLIGDRITWIYDPKSVKVGAVKYNAEPFFTKSSKISALLKAPSFVLAFGADNKVDEYSQDGPHHSFAGRYLIDQTFTGYPHKSVDAAHSEYALINREWVLVFTLFHKDKIWQFQEKKSILDSDRNGVRQFDPIPNMSGVLTNKWKGVYACNVDAVIQYGGQPYYVKGNTFWPATNTTEAIARDLTYNFLRCWRYPPEEPKIPTDCSKSSSAIFKAPVIFLIITVCLSTILL